MPRNEEEEKNTVGRKKNNRSGINAGLAYFFANFVSIVCIYMFRLCK